jgi:hypothetical protein
VPEKGASFDGGGVSRAAKGADCKSKSDRSAFVFKVYSENPRESDRITINNLAIVSERLVLFSGHAWRYAVRGATDAIAARQNKPKLQNWRM